MLHSSHSKTRANERRLKTMVGLKTWMSLVQCLFTIINVAMGLATSILLSDRDSNGFISHRIGFGEICGNVCHTTFLSSSGNGSSIRNSHHGFGVSPHAGSKKGRVPNLALYSVNGKMSLHTSFNLWLNHPISWVGFAFISMMTTSRISITSPSSNMAHLGFG